MIAAGENRLEDLSRLGKTAHGGDGFGRRTDPRDPTFDDAPGKPLPLGEESVSRMNGFRADTARRVDDRLAAQVARRGWRGTKVHRFICFANMRRVRVRVRRKLKGSAERPRLAVFKSGRHIYAQVIDDATGRTLAHASTLDAGVRQPKTAANLAGAKNVGKLVAERAKQKGVARVVFDRGGYIYHGKVKALAEAAREGGLEF